VITPDLPGRGGVPIPDPPIRIEHFVEAVLRDIDSHGAKNVVLVGHSFAGVTLPGVAHRLGARAKRLVYVSATVPTRGDDAHVAFPAWSRALLRASARKGSQVELSDRMPDRIARRWFCSDLDEDGTRFVMARLQGELLAPALERVSLSYEDVPSVPTTYVRLTKDRAVSPRRQMAMARRLGSRCSIVDLAAGHDVMISQPEALAHILNELVWGA